ncbi:MAG: hypothetical protein ACOCZ3_01675 [Bacillota bacterium]
MRANLLKKRRKDVGRHHHDQLPEEFTRDRELVSPEVVYEETKEKNMIRMFMYE